MPTDKLFYVLLQTVPGIVLELLNYTDNSDYEYRAVEVKETSFRFDGVLLPKEETPEQPTIFVEVQFQKDAYFYHRLFAEIFIFLKQNPQVKYWQAVIFFEKESREPEHQEPFRVLLDSSQVQRIYLNELRQDTSVSLEVAVAQLIVTQRKSAIEFALGLLARAKTQSVSNLSESKIVELIETIIVYKFPELTREEVANMLMFDELKQTRVYKDAVVEGEQKGQCRVVLRLLTQKLGSIPESTASKVQALSSDKLDRLGDRLLNLSTLQELNDYLASL